MTVYELLEKIGGEIVRGRARIRVGSEYIVIGQLNGDNMEYTEAGRLMAAEQSDSDKPKRGRPLKAAVVESEQAEIEVILSTENLSEEVLFPTVDSAPVQGITTE